MVLSDICILVFLYFESMTKITILFKNWWRFVEKNTNMKLMLTESGVSAILFLLIIPKIDPAFQDCYLAGGCLLPINAHLFVSKISFLCQLKFRKMHLNDLTPRVSKHYLFIVAALVWTFAGSMLLFRGLMFNATLPSHRGIKLMAGVIGGLLFFRLLFNRISSKHVLRIVNLPVSRPCIFSFFNLRSYLMMFTMITLGITLRKTEVISAEYLSLMYVTMGIPLLMSSVRFYLTFFRS